MPLDESFTPFLSPSVVIPEEEDRKEVFLQDQFTNMVYSLNAKTIGVYQPVENLSGEVWQYGTTSADVKKVRNGYKIISFVPSFTNGLAITQPIQNIDPNFIMTLCWGTASLPKTATPGSGDYFSFMAQGDSRIQFTISDTTINITTDGARAAYHGFIVQQYIRTGN